MQENPGGQTNVLLTFHKPPGGQRKNSFPFSVTSTGKFTRLGLPYCNILHLILLTQPAFLTFSLNIELVTSTRIRVGYEVKKMKV